MRDAVRHAINHSSSWPAAAHRVRGEKSIAVAVFRGNMSETAFGKKRKRRSEDDSGDSSDDTSSDDGSQQNETSVASSSPAVLQGVVEPREHSSEAPRVPKTMEERDNSRRLIVVLEQAALETVKTNRGYQLLNAEDHRGVHKKLKRDPSESRPDICHLELMALLDSPLSKAGLVQIFIQTKKNVLIEVNPQIRIPRTYKRFAGLMVQLLHKLKIRATSGPQWLLRVVKNPVTRHLPTGCRKYGMSVTGTLVDVLGTNNTGSGGGANNNFIAGLPQDQPVVFVAGAFAHGHLTMETTPYVDEFLSLSEYPLSGAMALSRLCSGFERHWGIL